MKRVLILFILAIMLAGCSQQIVCNTPYIQKGTDCCLDQNQNRICDDDETPADDTFKQPVYVGEPEYAEPEYTSEPVNDYVPEPAKEYVLEPEPVVEDKTAQYTVATQPEPVKPILWSAMSDYILVTVTDLDTHYVSKIPVVKGGSDKDVYLDSITLKIKNRAYAMMHPVIYIEVWDDFSTAVKTTLDCDDIEGCVNLRNDAEVKVTIPLDAKLRREGDGHTILITVMNKDDPMIRNQVNIEEPFDGLDYV